MKATIERSSDPRANFSVEGFDLERRAVLCAIDGLSRSDAAVRRAQGIARALGAQLLLLHVVDSATPARIARRRSARAQFILDEHTGRPAGAGAGVLTLVRSGRPYEIIAEVAAEWDADLIVLGRYRRRFGDSLRGTTAERIARQAKRPVLVVNQDAAIRYENVLLAADLSRMAAGIASVAKQLGLLARSRTSVVHALAGTRGAKLCMAGATQSELGQYQESLRQMASDEIDVQLFSAGVDAARFTIYSPQVSPMRGIEQVAQRAGSDLIVVGSSRFPVLKRLLLGSVSNEVLRTAKHDVLLVSPAAARRVRQRASALAMHRLTESPQRSLELH